MNEFTWLVIISCCVISGIAIYHGIKVFIQIKRELESEICSICGKPFTDNEWLNRHDDEDGEDCHERCCPICYPKKGG